MIKRWKKDLLTVYFRSRAMDHGVFLRRTSVAAGLMEIEWNFYDALKRFESLQNRTAPCSRFVWYWFAFGTRPQSDKTNQINDHKGTFCSVAYGMLL